jgi:glutathione S-transferase
VIAPQGWAVGAGIDFQDKRLRDREEFASLKAAGEFPFGSVPVLYIEDNDVTTTIAQSPTIMRYAGKLCGMYPEDPTAAALVDQVVDGANDATAKVMAAGKEGGAEVAAQWLQFYDSLLHKAGGVYFDGNGLSIAEICVYCMMTFLSRMVDMKSLPEDFPFLSAMLDEVAAHPKVAEWTLSHKL